MYIVVSIGLVGSNPRELMINRLGWSPAESELWSLGPKDEKSGRVTRRHSARLWQSVNTILTSDVFDTLKLHCFSWHVEITVKRNTKARRLKPFHQGEEQDSMGIRDRHIGTICDELVCLKRRWPPHSTGRGKPSGWHGWVFETGFGLSIPVPRPQPHLKALLCQASQVLLPRLPCAKVLTLLRDACGSALAQALQYPSRQGPCLAARQSTQVEVLNVYWDRSPAPTRANVQRLRLSGTWIRPTRFSPVAGRSLPYIHTRYQVECNSSWSRFRFLLPILFYILVWPPPPWFNYLHPSHLLHRVCCCCELLGVASPLTSALYLDDECVIG